MGSERRLESRKIKVSTPSARLESLEEEFFRQVGTNDAEVVRTTLERHPDLIFAQHPGQFHRPLHEAIDLDGVEIANCLLDFTQTQLKREVHRHELQGQLLRQKFRHVVDGMNQSKRSPLAELLRRPVPNQELVIKLINAKADLCSRDEQGMTPVLHCAQAGHLSILKILLKVTQGALLGERDNSFRTVLHCAASAGKADMVGFLLQVKADHEAVDIEQRTPGEAAEAAGHRETIRLMSSLLHQPETQEEPGTSDIISPVGGADEEATSPKVEHCQ